MITVLIVEPGKPPELSHIPNDHKAWQKIVGGYIAAAMPFEENVVILHNDDGIALNLPPNRRINGQIVPGTFIIAGQDDGGELLSFTPEQVEQYSSLFAVPDIFNSHGHWKVWHEESNVGGWFCLRILTDWVE